MAGHSAWKNIKHKKAAIDAKRGKVWSKCARAIIVAAKAGGGDPDSNLTLRYAIDDAKSQNMPKDTIEKAIKKGTGELGAESYESAMYEGYGPGGVAFLLEILTNNRNRTAGEIRQIFERANGNLGASGCVAYMFAAKGLIIVLKSAAAEDKLMELALDAGAQDVQDAGEAWQVICEPTDFVRLRQALEKAGIALESAGLTQLPNLTVTCTGETARKTLALIDALEDHDDVQKVHANYDIPEADLAALQN
ncbi:MAG: YebC/PmpR family DNA-binding transcriptional regulator [Phycisphaeraceae bacterium]|nr:YebC/PmpR family DNA-binding transcriptional regulator [Phycisphaeraceae bacterium]